MGPKDGTTGASGRVRKASYYVWFLGAWECRGLRGSEVVRPALSHLLAKERESEPDKVTLQVSGRGVKVLRAAGGGGRGGTRHIIPAAAITYVEQGQNSDDDLVSAVLLLYNPSTRCPVHLHTYRCDSTQTATLLATHLAQLPAIPAHQAKLNALEARLASRGLLPAVGSDGVSTGSSASSGSRNLDGGVASLYDSLAAELREKIGSKSTPLLLPPRDYDTRPRGRRAPGLTLNVSQSSHMSTPQRKPHEDDSARSSGIGSDDAPSPTHELMDPPDPPSSSDEEWEGGMGGGEDRRPDDSLQPSPWRNDTHSSRPRPIQVANPRGRTRHPHPPSPTRPQRDMSPIRPVRRPQPRCESPGSPRERFQDARNKFRSLERDWQPPGARSPDAVLARTPSWEANPRPMPTRGEPRSPGDEGLWPKSDRDTGYGSRDGLLRGRRDFDRGYGTCDTRDSDPWRLEGGMRTPDPWGREPRALSPVRASRDHREHRMPRIRSPERPDYHRAKSMHDLSQRRMPTEEERRGSHDPRRRSMYDSAEQPRPLRESRSARRYRSQASLRRRSSSCSSSSGHSANSYTQIPDSRRIPGLDRATARPDPLDRPTGRHYELDRSLGDRSVSRHDQLERSARHHDHLDRSATSRHESLDNIRSPQHSGGPLGSKRTYDYPVNGGTSAVHISRAQYDDYRRFRYDHATTPQFVRPGPSHHY